MKVSRSTMAFVVLMSISAVISAQEGYIGAGIGQSKIKDSPIDFDNTDMGWKLFGGYRFNKYFAIEGTWTDFGEPDDKYLGYNVSVEASAFDVSVLGIIPVHERFEIFGKIGLNAWKATAQIEGSDFDTEDNIDPTYGVGAAFNVNQELTFRGEWQAYEMSEIDDASLISLSVVHYFSL